MCPEQKANIAIFSDLYYGKVIHVINVTWRKLAKDPLPVTAISL